MTTPLKLTYLTETPQARLYQDERAVRKWVPRSVIKRCLGPATRVKGDLHEVTIEDWWLAENPWEIPPQAQKDLF